MVDGCGEEARDQKNQDWGYYKGEMFSWNMDDEEIQCQLSAAGGKQKIWETIATKLNDKYESNETA